tara:strand:- start:1468 stop:2268 length:801 start_codon:yes stop_codon:yes gene_type:complete
MPNTESEMSKPKSNLFGDATGIIKTGVSLLAGLSGGPGGYAAAQALFGLAEGNSLQDSLQQGLGGFFNASTVGPAGAALMGMGSSDGNRNSPEAMGLGAFMNSMNTQEGQQRVVKNVLGGALVGGTQGGVTGAMASIMNPNYNVDPKAAMLELFKQQNTVRDDETMSKTQQAQYATGERTTYGGTALPGTPRQMLAQGGMIDGPGTGTSDSIPAMIYQNGGPVQEARLSDGEFVMTADAVRGAGGGDRDAGAAKMYRMMNQLEGVA